MLEELDSVVRDPRICTKALKRILSMAVKYHRQNPKDIDEFNLQLAGKIIRSIEQCQIELTSNTVKWCV